MPRRAKGRSNGEGSIYESPKDSGIWHAQVRVEGKPPIRRRAKSQFTPEAWPAVEAYRGQAADPSTGEVAA